VESAEEEEDSGVSGMAESDESEEGEAEEPQQDPSEEPQPTVEEDEDEHHQQQDPSEQGQDGASNQQEGSRQVIAISDDEGEAPLEPTLPQELPHLPTAPPTDEPTRPAAMERRRRSHIHNVSMARMVPRAQGVRWHPTDSTSQRLYIRWDWPKTGE